MLPVDIISAVPVAQKSTQLVERDEEMKPLITSIKNTRRWYASPKLAVAGGLIEVAALLYFLRGVNVIEGSFFNIGPPVQLFQYTVRGQYEYLGILAVFFFHQLVFTWVAEIVSPWILNEIQDPKCKSLSYSKSQTLTIINLYYTYFTINSVLVLNVSTSQITFLFVILAADLIATTALNLHYVWTKKIESSCIEDDSNLELEEV